MQLHPFSDRKEKRKTQKLLNVQIKTKFTSHVTSRHLVSSDFGLFPANQFSFIIERKRITQSVDLHNLQLLLQLRNRFYIGEPEKRQNTFERKKSIE